ncbi:MAG: hypothetical protein ACLSHU_14840 [Oscillospiraceae bacterium]
MQKIVKRGLALLLCAVLALGAMSLTPSQAQEAPAPQGQSDYGPLTVYGKAGETTFVPAGYTYVYEEEDGSVYTREAARDMYISQRVLTPQEAEALAGLEGGETRYLTAEDGSTSSSARTLTPKRPPNTPRPYGKFWETPPWTRVRNQPPL